MAPQVSASFERLVVHMHHRLKGTRNPLGFCGAEAIYHELGGLGVHSVHSIRTIHRILVRLSKRYTHEFVRVVLRTGAQTLSVYWQESLMGHSNALFIDHIRSEKARTALV
jgi:hypothetical protein